MVFGRRPTFQTNVEEAKGAADPSGSMPESVATVRFVHIIVVRRAFVGIVEPES